MVTRLSGSDPYMGSSSEDDDEDASRKKAEHIESLKADKVHLLFRELGDVLPV